jgi:hypothetical protein
MKFSLSTIEPSFADAISSISATAELPERTRQQWCSALRSLARCFDQPAETIPARYSAVRARMLALHHVAAGCSAKTLANVKSNAKSALLYFRKEQGLLADGVELTPAWKALYRQLGDPSTRYRLAPVMRYCSAVGIGPDAFDDAVLIDFLAHRETTSSRASDAAARRIIARLWNACAGSIGDWPKTNLSAPPPKRKGGFPFESFPDGWQADVTLYLEHLTQVRRLPDGTRRRPCTPSTIEMRKRELVGAGNMAVRSGVAIEELVSLVVMLQPEIVNTIMEGLEAERRRPRGLHHQPCLALSLRRAPDGRARQ